MRVGVDARSLLAGRGIARVTRGLLRGLAAAHPGDDWHAFVPGRESVEPIAGVAFHRHPLPGRALFGAAAAVGHPTLEALLGFTPDVVWIPAPAPVALSRSTPRVLTVHDLSFVQRPQDFTPYERLWHRAARPARLARRATRVTAVSAATADELRRRWGVPATVVRPGVDRAPAGPALRAPGPPFLLFVGSLEPRKAPEVLVAAFRLARERGLDADLVVVGDGRMRDVLDGVPGVRRVRRPDDAALAALYTEAVALVLPSRLEGFGLPPLEALAHGTPSVVSDLPALREVLGDAALFVAAGDADALADALVRIAGDERLRAALVADGGDRPLSLTWESAAEQLHAVLSEAAATRS